MDKEIVKLFPEEQPAGDAEGLIVAGIMVGFDFYTSKGLALIAWRDY